MLRLHLGIVPEATQIRDGRDSKENMHRLERHPPQWDLYTVSKQGKAVLF